VRLALVLLGIQHLVRNLRACNSFASRSEVSIEVVPTSTGWPRFTQSWMSSRIGLELVVLGEEHEIRVVLADHRLVGRDDHHFQP
jgi:hypothetical protein